MTDKQIEKIKKYVELIQRASATMGMYKYRYIMADVGSEDEECSKDDFARLSDVCNYLILRMEREMKR